MQPDRNSQGKFIKGHKNFNWKNSEQVKNRLSLYFFKKGNTIRNTGKTRFKLGHVESLETKTRRGNAISKALIGKKRGICLIRRKREIRICRFCKNKFETVLSSKKQFCSISCGVKNRYIASRVGIICSFCGKVFKVPLCKKTAKFCSQKCMGKSFRGREQKQEWIDKQRIKVSGNKCWLWKGGISKEPYGQEFNNILKERIRQRDKFICQECKCTQNIFTYSLNVHHIDYNKHNNKENNLISLCRNCHAKTNYSRKEWIKYFTNKQKVRISI